MRVVVMGVALALGLSGCQLVERIAVMNAMYDEAVAACYGDETGGQCYLNGYKVARPELRPAACQK